MSNTTNDKGQNKQDFNVYSVQYHNEGSEHTYVHWSDGLVMYIEKNGVSIKLESDEIIQLVNALPRTIGGTY